MPAGPQQLQDILNAARVAGLPSVAEPGQEIAPRFEINRAALEALQAAPTLANIDLSVVLQNINLALSNANGALGATDLDVVMKSVEFPAPVESTAAGVSTANPVQRALPHTVPVRGPGSSIGTELSDAVEGLIGGITGSIRQAEQITGSLTATISGSIKGVAVLPPDRRPTITVRWIVEGPHVVIRGALDRLDLPPVLAFLPEFAELTGAAPEFSTRRLSCAVTITVKDFSEDTRVVGPIEIQVPKIQVPTAIVANEHAFDDGRFPGPSIVVVPHGSPLTSVQQVRAPIETVHRILTNVSRIANFVAPGALALLDRVKTLLAGTHVAFTRADVQEQVPDLSKVVRIVKGDILGDPNWQDVISSIIIVGMPGRAVSFHNRHNAWVGTGAFQVTIGNTTIAGAVTNLAHEVENEDGELNGTLPPVEPPETTFTIISDPEGARHYNDCISSLRFV